MADTYELDLLTSFDAVTSQGLLSPEDGMRRLHQLAQNGSMSAMRVLLRVEPHEIIIIDVTTGKETEHISLSVISNPTAIVNRNEKFNNVVMFTVLEDSYKFVPPEMHIFQCLGKSAQEVVDKIIAAKTNRLRREGSSAQHRQSLNDEQARGAANNANPYKPMVPPKKIFLKPSNREVQTNSETNQDVQLLDRCFDDIERFVERLQHAAEAFKELERRKRDRHSDVQAHGDGMLGMRARPPPAKDFIDIFQKFKLSFNLLAKLKGHIHNPNAPELVHVLFTPLTLVVDASKDPTGTPVLPTRVASPLLTGDALSLLSNCLTTKEQELWMLLGPAWCKTREQWPESVPQYIPHFYDGWSPPPFWVEDNGQMALGVTGHNQQLHRHSLQERDDLYLRPEKQRLSVHDTTPYKPADNGFADVKPYEPDRPPARVSVSAEERQNKFIWDLKAKGAKICLVIHEKTADNEKELTVKQGEIVEVLDNSKSWWNVRNCVGQSGYVPHTIMKPYVTNDIVKPESPRRSYTEESPPVSYQYYQPAPVDRPVERPVDRPVERPVETRVVVPVAEPVPASVTPPVNYVDVWAGDVRPEYRQRTAIDDLTDEFREKIRAPGPPVARKPSKVQAYYIDSASTPEEISEWLAFKGFSSRVQQVLARYDGTELFKLTRTALERLCGLDEGGRVYSQILVQRNRSGYQTARASELQAILQRRKLKSDNSVSGSTSGSVSDIPPDSGNNEVF